MHIHVFTHSPATTCMCSDHHSNSISQYFKNHESYDIHVAISYFQQFTPHLNVYIEPAVHAGSANISCHLQQNGLSTMQNYVL